VGRRSSWIVAIGPRGTWTVDLSAEIFRHFGISATGRYKGQESGLLTHEILKERKPSDQGRLTAVDLPLKWNFGISGFDISAFRDPGVRRVKNCCSRNREILKRENPKAFGGIAPGHGTGSRGQDPSGELVTRQPFRGSAFQSFGVRHFRNPEDKEPGHFELKTPEVTKHDVSLEWGCGHTFRHFGVRLFGTSDDKESGILVLKPPKSRNPKSLFGKGRGHIWWPCGGEDSCLVHFLCRWSFREGPVDRIRGVPVRARKN
jgi:hypothetical protein